jgi:hypothetical protein
MSTDPNTITEKQQAFILRLLDEREHGMDAALDTIKATVPEMSKQQASDMISALLKYSEKASAPKDDNYGIPSVDDLPAGRYAINSADGELTFYEVWRGTRKPEYVKLYVLHGPDSTEVPFGKGMVTILKSIAQEAGAAAVRYGHEIGACSICNKRLTNRVSRALGIGPVCGGRFWGEEFKSVVHGAREQIKAQGLDPDENVEEDEDVVHYDVSGDFEAPLAPVVEIESALRNAMPNASDNQVWTSFKDAALTMSDAELDSVIALLTREQEKREFAKREREQENAAYEAKMNRDQSFLGR